jgi:hypothetical protein
MEKEVKIAIVTGIFAVLVTAIQYGMPDIPGLRTPPVNDPPINTSKDGATTPTVIPNVTTATVASENKLPGLQNLTPDKTNEPPKLNDLYSDRESPQDARTDITWTAKASDPNNDSLEYKFLLERTSPPKGVKLVRDWAPNNTWTWKTTDEDIGSYRVQVQVRDGKHLGTSYDDVKNEGCTIEQNKTTYRGFL